VLDIVDGPAAAERILGGGWLGRLGPAVASWLLAQGDQALPREGGEILGLLGAVERAAGSLSPGRGCH
jgi:hypothetical protein